MLRGRHRCSWHAHERLADGSSRDYYINNDSIVPSQMERAHYVQERSLPELKDLLEKKIFSKVLAVVLLLIHAPTFCVMFRMKSAR